MHRSTVTALLLSVLVLAAAVSAKRVRRQSEPSGNFSGDASGEASGESGNFSGDISGDASGGNVSGETSGELSGESGDLSGDASSGASGDISGESGAELSGEESGFSGDETSGEIITDLPAGTMNQLNVISINLAALQVQADSLSLQSQSLADQANLLSNSATAMSDSVKTISGQLNTVIAETTTGTTTAPEISNDTNATCSAVAHCVADSDCNGGTCLGAFLGTCNCTPCLNLLSCDTDAQCGGLVGACSSTTKTCDCTEGFKQAGFPDLLSALTGFCNVKSCGTNIAESCSGLPCNMGTCLCPVA